MLAKAYATLLGVNWVVCGEVVGCSHPGNVDKKLY